MSVQVVPIDAESWSRRSCVQASVDAKVKWLRRSSRLESFRTLSSR
jgi:hypothetical protein